MMGQKQAFSLVELSIVLVILGLLVGGVLAGQSLIAGAKLRGQVKQLEQNKTVVYQFRDKYFAVPGDMSNATAFWPTSYNGNGNRTLEWRGFPTCQTCSRYFAWEMGLYWQHLALAGLIEGAYPNYYPSTGSGVAPIFGTDVPLLKLHDDKALGVGGPSSAPFPSWNLAFYTLGQQTALPGDTGATSPEESWQVDTKLDDGAPDQGDFRAVCSNPCPSACLSGTSAYSLTTSSTTACRFVYAIER